MHPGDTPELLQQRVMEQAEWELLPMAVQLIADNRIMVEDNIIIIKDTIKE